MFDKKNPCINKKVDWVSILLLASQINFNETGFVVKKMKLLRKIQFQVKKSLHIRYKLENVNENDHKRLRKLEKLHV